MVVVQKKLASHHYDCRQGTYYTSHRPAAAVAPPSLCALQPRWQTQPSCAPNDAAAVAATRRKRSLLLPSDRSREN